MLKDKEGSPKKDKYGLFVESDNKRFVNKKTFERAKSLH